MENDLKATLHHIPSCCVSVQTLETGEVGCQQEQLADQAIGIQAEAVLQAHLQNHF